MIKFMTKSNKKMNFFLALGMACLILGIVLFFIPPADQRETSHLFINSSILLITAASVYISLLLKSYVAFYVSTNCCIDSLIMLIMEMRGMPSPLKRYWPLAVIISGVSLLVLGTIRYKKFRSVYVFPAATLTILGSFFLLFTLRIIKVPLRVFSSFFLPVFLILGGMSLIVIYYVRQNAGDKFPIIKDVEKDDYDEEDYD